MLERAFSAHGVIEQLKMVNDRMTGQFKGIAFVKFAKASSAAFALEALNGTAIEGEPALKVMFAEPQGTRPVETTEPLELPARSRLFVTCPKDMTKDQLQALFSNYGEVESVKLLMDKATDQSKGIAYVKYTKASSAAVAIEKVTEEAANATSPRPVRCRVAEPRTAVRQGAAAMPHQPYMGLAHYPMWPMLENPYMAMHEMTHFPEYPPITPGFGYKKKGPTAASGAAGAGETTAERRRHDNNNPPGSRLFISFSKPLPTELLHTIFMRYGLLETVYLVKGKNYGYAKYATAHAAQVALHNLNNKLVEGVACRVSVADPQKASFKAR
jgi:RNA recognition motif-containing protein